MTDLATTCFTVEDGKIIEGTLNDFRCYIKSTTRPTGIGYEYYATTVTRSFERDTWQMDEDGEPITEPVQEDVWVLAKWATWGGPEVVVREFESEEQAKTAAEETYVYDILNNSEMSIHLERSDAESELAELQAE